MSTVITGRTEGFPTEASDAELITRVRAGDRDAFGALFARHSDAARKLATRCTRTAADADDLVAESFEAVFNALKRGAGPDLAFRAYLFTTLRRTAANRQQKARRVEPVDDIETDPLEPFVDPALSGLERTLVARAYGSLPERWQVVLWHTEIEGSQPADVAVLLGMTANAVAALAYRAREGLRQAYLQMHLADGQDDRCLGVVGRLGAFVRGGLPETERAKIEAHLDECEKCEGLYLELADVNTGMMRVVAPLFLGTAASSYLGAVTVGGGGATGAGLLGKWWQGRPAAVGTAAAAAVVAVGIGAYALSGAVGGGDGNLAAPQAPAAVAGSGETTDDPTTTTASTTTVPTTTTASTTSTSSVPVVTIALPTTTEPPTTPPPPTTTLPPPTTTTIPPTTTTTVPFEADLLLTVQWSSTDEAVVHLFKVTNLGPDSASDLVMTIELSSVAFVDVINDAGWSCTVDDPPDDSPVTVICVRATLDPPASAPVVLLIAGEPGPPAPTATASVSSATPDPDTSNNSWSSPT